MKKELTLDIGIGYGGTYLRNNHGTTIGLDYDRLSLQLSQITDKVKLIQANAEMALPFVTGIFKHVDMVLPHDELLYDLTGFTSNIWNEIYRVTKKNADVSIIVDVPFCGNQGIFVHGKPTLISVPHVLIIDCAVEHGFKPVNFQKMSSEEMNNLGTSYSEWISKDMKNLRTSAYNITVKK